MGDQPHRNLLEDVAATLVDAGLADEVRVLPPHRASPLADVLAIACRGGGRQPPATAFPRGSVAAVSPHGPQLRVRCTDASLAAVGAALEAGDARAMAPPAPADGRRCVVGMLDQNATKALHLGHLRNIALGNAVASALAAAGACVTRQSQIADAGRSMGEALGGYVRFAAGTTPAAAGLKSDRFVGSCYGRYVQAQAAERAALGADAPPDAALSREDAEHDDLAEELLRRRRASDPQIVELWRRMRDWALDGQDATLARLGVVLDWRFLESDFAAQIDAFGERVVVRGVARREANGGVVYDTGRRHYPRLLLNRCDGFPTQHLRYMALWDGTREVLRGTRSVQVIGDEWRALALYADEIMRGVADGDEVHPTQVLLHGMVDVDGLVPKSSQGEPPLIDDLLDELAAEVARRPPWDAHERVPVEDAAAAAALGACLAQPAERRLSYDRRRLLDEASSPGWAMARALAVASEPRYDGSPSPDVADPRYRYLVVRSQAHARQVAQAAGTLEVEPLLRFYAHLSRAFLSAPPSAALARATRTVLRAGFAALGLPGARAAPETHQAGLEPAPSA